MDELVRDEQVRQNAQARKPHTRIAYFSPMPPDHSGIADYSVELLAWLTSLLEVDVYTAVAAPTTHIGMQLYPYEAYAARKRHVPYSLNVYAMGNHPAFHSEIFDLALREPGLVIMHDLTLYDFYQASLGARTELLADEIEYAHGPEARLRWRKFISRSAAVDRLEFNLARRIAQSSRALVAHSAWGCEVLRAVAPDVPVFHIPMGGVLHENSAARSRRAALRIPTNAFIAGTFGHVEPVKRIVELVTAFGDVVDTVPDARLLIAGRTPNAGYLQSIKDTVRRLNLTRNVLFLGEPPLAEFEEYIQTCDVIVNLRWPTCGETSAIIPRAFGLGKPVITSDIPQTRDYSEACCWRIPHDEREREQLVKTLLAAAQQPETVLRGGQAAQAYMRNVAQWKLIADAYARTIADVIAIAPSTAPTRPQSENPLRAVTGVNCIGDISADVGLGTAARQMLETIVADGIPASFIEREFPASSHNAEALEVAKGLPTQPIYPTNLLFYNINDMQLLSDEELTRLTAGKWTIARWFWELSQLSDEWIKRIDRVDEIWVASKFTQASLQAVTSKPVIVIPVSIEVPTSDHPSRARFDLPEDRFIFIFTFAATSTEARKNPFGVIEAFEKAFGRPEGPGSPFLVIKAHYADQFPKLKADLERALQRVGGKLISENFSRRETNDLLACADCYVSLHRAEGFGLGPAESMYLGKPVIATNYSGNVDFMTPENSYLVNYRERTIVARDHKYHEYGHLVYQPGMVWAEPNLDHAAQLMLRVFENPAERAQKGARAASDIHALYSHEAVAQLIRTRLAEIERDRPFPTKNLAGGLIPVYEGSQLMDEQLVLSSLLQRHKDAFGSLEWSRTRDKSIPFQRVKGLSTALRVLARVLVQGRINERQQWINTAIFDEVRILSGSLAALAKLATKDNVRSDRVDTSIQEQVAHDEATLQTQLKQMQARLTALSEQYERDRAQLEHQIRMDLSYIQQLQQQVELGSGAPEPPHGETLLLSPSDLVAILAHVEHTVPALGKAGCVSLSIQDSRAEHLLTAAGHYLGNRLDAVQNAVLRPEAWYVVDFGHDWNVAALFDNAAARLVEGGWLVVLTDHEHTLVAADGFQSVFTGVVSPTANLQARVYVWRLTNSPVPIAPGIHGTH